MARRVTLSILCEAAVGRRVIWTLTRRQCLHNRYFPVLERRCGRDAVWRLA